MTKRHMWIFAALCEHKGNTTKTAEDLKLRIGCCDSIDACCLPKYITYFNHLHPGVSIRTCIDTPDSLSEQIEKNELDLAIIDKAVDSPGILSDDFIGDNLAFGCSPALEYAEGEIMPLSTLVKQPLLLRNKKGGARIAFDKKLKEHNFSADPIFESASANHIINAALNGMGIAVLPAKMLHPYHKHGRLILIHVADETFPISYHMIYRKGHVLTPMSMEFMNMCKTYAFSGLSS